MGCDTKAADGHIGGGLLFDAGEIVGPHGENAAQNEDHIGRSRDRRRDRRDRLTTQPDSDSRHQSSPTNPDA